MFIHNAIIALFLSYSSGLIFAQTSLNFTNCGQSGKTGPNQSQVNSEYSGTSLAGLVTINTLGIQEWTVPTTGTYTIEASGAQAGNATSHSNYPGGKGAVMQGDFDLSAGQVIYILVGQQGGTYSSCSAGGGGTFVVKKMGS